MRPPAVQCTIRSMMIAVAGVGMVIGGAIEIVRLRRLSREYSGRVISARRALAYARISAGWSDERWLAECQDIDRRNRESDWFKMGRPLSPDVARERIAYWEPIRSKYERAARYPWLPVGPDPPRPE
jgi:hypothetical protein